MVRVGDFILPKREESLVSPLDLLCHRSVRLEVQAPYLAFVGLGGGRATVFSLAVVGRRVATV